MTAPIHVLVIRNRALRLLCAPRRVIVALRGVYEAMRTVLRVIGGCKTVATAEGMVE